MDKLLDEAGPVRVLYSAVAAICIGEFGEAAAPILRAEKKKRPDDLLEMLVVNDRRMRRLERPGWSVVIGDPNRPRDADAIVGVCAHVKGHHPTFVFTPPCNADFSRDLAFQNAVLIQVADATQAGNVALTPILPILVGVDVSLDDYCVMFPPGSRHVGWGAWRYEAGHVGSELIARWVSGPVFEKMQPRKSNWSVLLAPVQGTSRTLQELQECDMEVLRQLDEHDSILAGIFIFSDDSDGYGLGIIATQEMP